MSAECGFERTYISRVEHGLLNPTAVRLWMIADALSAPFNEMVRRMEVWLAERQKSR
jgi:transcriptional regulator with XRE-family HTH domain